MLPRDHRMVDTEEFSETLKTGIRVGSRYMVVTVAVPAVGTAFVHAKTRVGLVVAKKQIPLAVDRNRVKRQIRHVVRELLEQLPEGSKIVIRVLTPARELSSQQIKERLEGSVQRILKKTTRPDALQPETVRA